MEKLLVQQKAELPSIAFSTHDNSHAKTEYFISSADKDHYFLEPQALDKKGIQISKKYTMDDGLNEMKGEYEMIKSEQQKKNSVKFQGKMLMAFVSGIEFLNGKFDPFDIKLDGWGEAVSENLDE